ncbi:MAG: restriction endonuclease subunit R [Planctomycetes bacterium RBG_13_46_10]|nr:MAG: restriction endonuclease subunit R [Planctomycetes bacterium RBG_13_46_10]
MEPKEYQIKALNRVKQYLDLLYQWREKAISNPGLKINFPLNAWDEIDSRYRPYSSRKDGLGRPLPCFCLKIPTGGGKTFLAVKSIDLINTVYRKKQTGLVLWIVPSTQIYNQTIRGLRNRDHPYRQHLDIASGGRTLIREKTDLFSPLDVSENLVVLMLMLPSANRKTKEVLRMFKDSGSFAEFFPAEDDLEANTKLLEKIPNLDTFEKESRFWGKQVKTSLGNTLRMLNPVIILDEGHKAYSETAQETLQGFNPSIIVELSATPPDKSNKLVDVTGIELNREEMIKFDLHIFNKANPDWKETILEAHNHLEMLKGKAREHHANTGKYIRPICLIQVERTGKEQRGKKFIHAEDVREHLINIVGLQPEEVAVKTSEKDELKEVDDIGGLMSENCRIRYIITKQALQEGWDCAFAYVLAILTRPGSKTALTQLVGRILRQPFAKKTGLKELDESYVFCYQQEGAELLEEIRKGFRGEGLGDLQGRILMDDESTGQEHEEVSAQVREKFTKASDQIILPVFAIRDGSDWRKVNYDMDIASQIPWDRADLSKLDALNLSMLEEKDVEQVATLSEDQREVIKLRQSELLKAGALHLDSVFLARHLLDIVPNPWIAYEFGKTILNKLLTHFDQKIVINNFVFIIEEMRKHLAVQKDILAEKVFRDMISRDKMHFLVIANKLGYKFPRRKKTAAPYLTKKTAASLERTLFDPVSADDFNETEKQVAWYLDDQNKLLFWYRNIPKQDYGVQGWRSHRVYADFIFTDTANGNGFNRVFVVETKGLHLKDSERTEYTRKLFNLCNEQAQETTLTELGLKLSAKQISFLVIAEDEWQNRFNALFS